MGPSDFRDTILIALTEAKEEAKKLGRQIGGREISLVITKLEEALLWANQSYKLKGTNETQSN